MSIRAEFEKAFKDAHGIEAWADFPIHDTALWAAKWMADKICSDESCGPFMAEKIRQMEKELEP